MTSDPWLFRNEVAALTRRSPASLWRDVPSGRFPVPVQLGPRRVAWRRSTVVMIENLKEIAAELRNADLRVTREAVAQRASVRGQSDAEISAMLVEFDRQEVAAAKAAAAKANSPDKC